MAIALSANRLRDAREARGLSQVEAAEAIGVSRGTLQNAETGRFAPRADALARMAAIYGVSIDSLFIHDPEADTASTGQGENKNDGAGRDLTASEIAATGARGE